MISVVENGEVYEVSFRYDPVLVAKIKNVPGKRWNPQAKMWTIPKEHLGWWMNELKDTPYESQVQLTSSEAIGENATVDTTVEIPDVDISGIKLFVENGKELYKHQTDFMKYALHRDTIGRTSGFILADEPGAGKTLECMNLAMYRKTKYKYKHCLIIVCVNPAKYNWVEDIVKHTNGAEEPYILGTRLKRDKVTKNCSTGTKEKLADLVTGHMYGDKSAPKLPYFIVMNIEGLRATTGKGKARKFPITDEIIKWVHTGKINMIAIDEIHKNTSPTSTQGKQLLRIKKETDRKVYWMPITGTPITNTPTDVFTPLKLVDGHAMSSYYAWCQRFCVYGGYGGYEIVSYKNIPQLKSMLQGNMIRRLKGDFIDLPPKIFYTDYVENTSYQEKLYDAVAAELQNEKGTILSSPNPAARFLRLRQVNGSPELIDSECHVTDKDYLSKNAKLTRCLELIDECTARGEKVIVFSNWVEPLRTLYKFVSQHYKVCCFTGTMKEAERQKHKEVFMTNPEYKVLIGTVGAMGVSHTLTAANNVIFYDEPWTPTDRDQALDRVHRPGATKTIHIHVLLSKDTVDDRVHEVLYTKEAISKYVVDNQLDFKHHPELFDMLIH